MKLIFEQRSLEAGTLYRHASAVVGRWAEGDVLLGCDCDPTEADLQQLAEDSEELKAVGDSRYDSLLYVYRNSLLHEFKEPGYGMEELGDDAQPFYHSMINMPWQLVFPIGFFRRLCFSGIWGVRNVLFAQHRNPYDAYPFGSLWRPRKASDLQGNLSSARALYLSAMRYHKEAEHLDAARDYLTQMYRKNFNRPDELPTLLNELTAYSSEYQFTGNAYVTVGRRISIVISDEFQLSGEIPRLDLVTTGGYAVWLFNRTQCPWRNELRTPPIQYHFARALGVNVQQITVGFYFLSPATYESECFPQRTIDDARRECESIGRVLTA